MLTFNLTKNQIVKQRKIIQYQNNQKNHSSNKIIKKNIVSLYLV